MGCDAASPPLQEFHRLHVGDVIKFGESTRLYVLEGPEEMRPAEYESDNLVRFEKNTYHTRHTRHIEL